MSLQPPPTLSPSKVSSFKDCALAFRFSAIDRLPEPPSAPAAKGTLVHLALQMLFRREPADRTMANAMADLDAAIIELADDPEIAELALTDDELAVFHGDAREHVRRYFEIEDPTKVNAIGLELMLEARVDTLRLRGIIDRLDLTDDGELVVVDYKTGRSPSERFEQSKLGGVHFYAFLCQEVLGRRPVQVKLLYLSDPIAIIATPTEQSVRGLAGQTKAIWKAVEQACARDDFRPRPGKLCSWCSFQSYCPAFGGDPALARAPLAVPA